MRQFKVLLTCALSALGVFGHPLESRQDKPRVLIDPELFPTLQRYTIFSVASLATFVFGNGKCPTPPFNSTVAALISNPITTTEAAIFQDNKAKEFIVSFVGSSSLQDFVIDFEFLPVSYNNGCTGCSVHSGFYLAYLSVANQTISALNRLTTANPDYSITLTGHSLGGALAAIAYPSLKATTKLPIKKVYTFGQPRVGNPAFARYVETISHTTNSTIGDYYRVTHYKDGVPNLPGQDMGFQHSETEFYELDNAADTQVANTTWRCFGEEALDCNRGAAEGFINQYHLNYTGIVMTNGAQCGISGGL